MKLTPILETMLKKPLGILIQGEMPQPYTLLRKVVANETIVAVGDVVSENLAKVGIEPSLTIIDGKTKRIVRVSESVERAEADIIVKNPKSTITKELWEAIKSSDFKNRKIFIDGEEDLATLPAILFAPEGSMVIYGQPDEGVVIVRVTKEKKDEIWSIICQMEGEKWK
ncbi:MAG: GTP-dependent dephospho-CoA kinase family protein [Candidatus Methanofastidiosia archaeon]